MFRVRISSPSPSGCAVRASVAKWSGLVLQTGFFFYKKKWKLNSIIKLNCFKQTLEECKNVIKVSSNSTKYRSYTVSANRSIRQKFHPYLQSQLEWIWDFVSFEPDFIFQSRHRPNLSGNRLKLGSTGQRMCVRKKLDQDFVTAQKFGYILRFWLQFRPIRRNFNFDLSIDLGQSRPIRPQFRPIYSNGIATSLLQFDHFWD